MNNLSEYQKIILKSYEIPYKNSLTNASPRKEQPQKIKISMRNHQLAMIHAMEDLEQKLSNGWKCADDKTAFGNYGILGDNVGVGKSLMILGHIASAKDITHNISTTKSSNDKLFVIQDKLCKRANSLIIVPHTIYKQWVSYIKEQTSFKFIGIASVKDVAGQGNSHEEIKNKLLNADIILITNTMLHLCSPYDLSFDRIFIDEADTIHITNGHMPFSYNFLWFITASWTNLIFTHSYLYLDTVKNYIESNNLNLEFRKQILSILNSSQGYLQLNGHIRSYYLYNYFNIQNPMNYELILRSSEQFIKDNTGIPDANISIIRCRSIITQKIIGEFITEEINNLIHAGDMKGAFEKLGVQTETPISLIEAVRLNKQAELDKLEAELEAIGIRIYSDEYTKENAKKRVEGRIISLKDQMKSFQERLENFKEETCGICFDSPENPALTPCCSRIFCAKCVFQSIKRVKSCPMCRHEPFNVKSLHYLNENADLPSKNTFETHEEEKLFKKEEVLMKILTDNPEGKFLIFSRYDNPFQTLEASIQKEGISVCQLKGTKNTITSRIKKFSEGKLKVLLLNNQYSGSGLNIVATTHIILWHAMTMEEEKQIIGRALRMGRTEDVTVIKLLNEGE